MTEGSFTEDDYKKFGEFINFVTKNMQTSNWSTNQCVEYVRLLGFMQNTVAKKIYDNVLEVKQLHTPEKKPAAKRSRSKSRS